MDCPHVLSQLDRFLDHELDSVSRREVERHLADCATCKSVFQQHRSLSAALGAQSRLYRASPALAASIDSALDKIDAAAVTRRHRLPPWVGLAASVAFAALLGSGATFWLTGTSQEEQLAQEIIAGHVRAQMVAGRLTDISSSDSHTVKPWFNGKLDFAPPVVDLAAQGYPLVGGRLDYLENHSVAALVYRHRQHLIHLFVWPATSPLKTARQTLTRQGFHLIYWSDRSMQYWAISDLNANALKTFSDHIQEQTGSVATKTTTGKLLIPGEFG